MPNHPSTTARLTAVQSYLEDEFPGHVEAARENVIVVSHDGIRHQVVLEPTFLKQCPHEKDFEGRNLTVNLAKPREQSRSSRW